MKKSLYVKYTKIKIGCRKQAIYWNLEPSRGPYKLNKQKTYLISLPTYKSHKYVHAQRNFIILTYIYIIDIVHLIVNLCAT